MAQLNKWPRPDGPLEDDQTVNNSKAVILIHGIFSDHHTFEKLHAKLSNDPRFGDFSFYYFDYDYHVSLAENGKTLASLLHEKFQPNAKIAIVAHSMGGLIARLAILTRPLPFLCTLFLLGTPNSGAIRLIQLGVLSQLLHAGGKKLIALFPRKSGIIELSNVSNTIRKNLSSESVRNAARVDYISIPGLYFNADRAVLDFGGHRAAKAFSAIDIALIIMTMRLPFFAINLKRPHDGIVEESSNSLFERQSGTKHEKMSSVRGNDETPATYAHVEIDECSGLTHIDVQKDDAVIETIASIVAVTWRLRDEEQPARLKGWESATRAGNPLRDVRFRN